MGGPPTLAPLLLAHVQEHPINLAVAIGIDQLRDGDRPSSYKKNPRSICLFNPAARHAPRCAGAVSMRHNPSEYCIAQ